MRNYFNLLSKADMRELIYRTEPKTKKVEKRKKVKNVYAQTCR